MKVVADSQALVRYLVDPARLSEPALDALLEAEDSDGVIVSAATLGGPWYASQKTSSPPVAPGIFEHIRDTLLDPSTNLVLQPISVATMMHFDAVPLNLDPPVKLRCEVCRMGVDALRAGMMGLV